MTETYSVKSSGLPSSPGRALSNVRCGRPARSRCLGDSTGGAGARLRHHILATAVIWAGVSALQLPLSAQVYRIDTLLGDFDPLEEVSLSEAWTDYPVALATDLTGNIFFAERDTYRIRKIDPSGRVSTVAGSGLSGFSGDGGPATNARLSEVEGLAIDRHGNIYIADTDNYRIRRVDPSGVIETIAGTGEWGTEGDGGPARNASMTPVYGIAADLDGNIYIADTWDDRIRKIDTAGTISTIAGTGEEGASGDGGPATSARLDKPRGVTVDTTGNVYIADSDNHRIRRVDRDGTITSIAGTGEHGYSGDGGLATEAALSEPYAVMVDIAGNIYIADADNRTVRRVDPSGIITTVAGTGPRGRGGRAGIGTEVYISRPRALAAGNRGEVYIADAWADRVLQLDREGSITELVASSQRETRNLGDVTADASGNVYVALPAKGRIVKVDPSGLETEFAGNGEYGFSGDNGPAVNARFRGARGVAADPYGNLYIADTNSHRIRMVDSGGIVTTIAGNGERGYGGDGGPASLAMFRSPRGVAVGADGSVYVADTSNHRIRKIDSSSVVTTIAGSGDRGLPEPGVVATRSPLSFPESIAVDSVGRVYIADRRTDRVYLVDESGMLEIAAGTGERGSSGDGGPAVDAALSDPAGVSVSVTDMLYIASWGSNLVRRVGRDGIISTIAGTGGQGGYDGDGAPARERQFNRPTRVAAYSDRKAFVVDSFNHRVRVLTAETPPPVVSAVLNGASYQSGTAPGSVAVIQGADLSSARSSANEFPVSFPLATTLAGTSVIVTESVGQGELRREAGLFSVSPTEIRFLMPDVTTEGAVSVTVAHEGALSEPVAIDVTTAAPGLFSANGDGRGVAAAAAVRVARDGRRTPLEVAQYDPVLKRYVALPLDVRTGFDRVYLTLFGTGIRGGSRPTIVTINGRHVTVQSSGPASGFHGVDEVLVGPLPRSIRNRELEVVATVDGVSSNAVTIAFK